MNELESLILAVFLEKGWKSAIEVGCGPGRTIGLVCQYLPVKGTGIDIARGYITEARKNFPKVRFLVRDGRHPLYLRADVVLTHGFLIHVDHKDIKRTIRNLMKSGKEGLFVESSAGNDRKGRAKYSPKKYWTHREKFPDTKDDLPMQYYYSHNYPKLFSELGFKFQIVKVFDRENQTRMYLCRK